MDKRLYALVCINTEVGKFFVGVYTRIKQSLGSGYILKQRPFITLLGRQTPEYDIEVSVYIDDKRLFRDSTVDRQSAACSDHLTRLLRQLIYTFLLKIAKILFPLALKDLSDTAALLFFNNSINIHEFFMQLTCKRFSDTRFTGAHKAYQDYVIVYQSLPLVGKNNYLLSSLTLTQRSQFDFVVLRTWVKDLASLDLR